MPKAKTQKQKFLDWLDKHKIDVKERKSGANICYNLNAHNDAVIVVQGVTLKLNPLQDGQSINVYFDKDGRWTGGTNYIWNTGLPWED